MQRCPTRLLVPYTTVCSFGQQPFYDLHLPAGGRYVEQVPSIEVRDKERVEAVGEDVGLDLMGGSAGDDSSHVPAMLLGATTGSALPTQERLHRPWWVYSGIQEHWSQSCL